MERKVQVESSCRLARRNLVHRQAVNLAFLWLLCFALFATRGYLCRDAFVLELLYPYPYRTYPNSVR